MKLKFVKRTLPPPDSLSEGWRMIKRVRVEDLKLGMYIHDLNCGWMDHNFLRSRFMLRKEEDLKKLHESKIGELYIDTVTVSYTHLDVYKRQA